MARGPGWILAALLLAACSEGRPEKAVAPKAEANPPPAAPAAPRAAGDQRWAGAGRGLTASVSGLQKDIRDLQVEVSEAKITVSLPADVLFAFDSAELGPEAAPQLQRTAEYVRQGSGGAVEIIGHTDAKGEPDYNLNLSRRRAQTVAGWLQKELGAAAPKLTPIGRGETEPVAPNAKPDGSDDPEGRQRNRRVVVVVPRR